MTDRNPSRRSVMLTAGAAGLAAAANPASTGARQSFSPEYLECERRWIELERVQLSQAKFHATDEEAITAWQAIERYRAAKDRLLERPVRTWLDVVALLRTEFWQRGGFVSDPEYLIADEAAPITAANALVGRWHVPADLVELHAKRRAIEKAFYESRSLRVDYDETITSSRSRSRAASDEEDLIAC